MVVTRKSPVMPTPPVSSRSTSSQQIPRAAGAKIPATIPNVPEQSSLANGGSQTSRSHDPNAKSAQKQSRKKKLGFFSLLRRALIFLFIIYFLFVCPNDTALEKPICRGLHLYRRLILEPFIMPPIRNALAHPSIAPHIARIQPHVDFVIVTVHTQSARVAPHWNKHIVPQWNRHVVPQWNRHVLPRWNKHVVPQWKKHVLPRMRRVQKKYIPLWQKHVVPRIWNAKKKYIPLWQNRVLPRIRRAQKKYIPLVHKIKVAVGRLLVLARAQRRQYVDPHVARIWEKVKELSRGKTRITSDVVPPFTSIILKPSLVPSSPNDEDVVDIFTLEPSPTSSNDEVEVDSTVSPSFTSITSDPSSVPPSQNDMDVDIDPTSLYVAPPSTSVTSEPSSQISDDTSSYVAPSSSSIISEPSIIPSFQNNEDLDIDLASFYADLGLDVQADKPDSTVLTAASSQETETEEERTERLHLLAEQTAKKRRDITARHVSWEEQLEAQIREKRKELRKALVAVRKVAVAELKESAEIRAQVEAFVGEAEKFLKGAEVYLKNLTKEKRKDEEKMSLWGRVVGKVETKFSEKLRDVETFVNQWYTNILDREMEAVKDAVVSVRHFAEKAQADIGLDYAWLEDVTYQDWQRYHALVGKSDNFSDQAHSIQNGSHPSPPINPILPALADLQSEVQDIVVGFETRLRRIKRSGERAFGVGTSEGEADIDDNQPEPEVSILPIPGDSEGAQGTAELNTPPVTIGRSKEEVLQAIERAGSQGEPVGAPQPDGSRDDPEGVEAQVPLPEVNSEAVAGPAHRMEL